MATLINPHQPEDNSTSALQSDSSQSALELLKPDPPIDNDDSTENNAEEADLEALRQAALLSIRPKKSAFKVQAHPVRNNLLSIIPVEEDEEKKPEKKVVKSFFNSRQPPAAARDSPSKTNKFNRYDSDKDKSSESESEYEEIEVEEEVTATESETETEKTTTTAASEENKKKLVKTQVSEADDVLNVDCSEEVDEFTNFLNEFEDDLKPKETAGQPKPKKTKKIMVKKRVKKEKPVKSSRNTNQTSRRTRSRSPGPLRTRRTPPPRSPPLRRAYSPRGSSRYSPPPYYRGGRRNSRSPSPYYRRPRRYSRSPSPRRRSPRPFRSPRRGAGSPRRYGRTPTLSPEPQRGSLSPSVSRKKSPNRNTGKGSSNGASSTNNKSKSLPPSKAESNSQKKQQVELTEEEKAKQIADDKLKTLSSPERERLLQRRKKFESNLPIQTVGTKKISLKNKDNQHRFDEKSNIETNNSRDNNKKRSYPDDDDGENNSEDDADDTLDKFEDEQRGTAKNRRQPKEKAPSKTNVTDLRVQLYKKRQKMQQQQKQAEPEMQEGQPEVDQEYPKSKFREIEPELDDYDDDRDSLEKAQLSSSEEEEFTHRNIQITSTNRIVKKPSKSPPKPKKRLIKEEMPLKKSAIRPTLMSRLGGKVPSEDDYSEEEEDLATSPPLRFKSKASKSSDENSEKKKNKKEKKEKKKEKKEKKKSKKEKKSKKNQNNSSSENDGKDGGKVDEDDLFKYFENMDNENQFHGKNIDKEDILLEQMKKKNDKLVKRQQEIEKDRKLHS